MTSARLALIGLVSVVLVGCGSTVAGGSPAARATRASQSENPIALGGATQRSEAGSVTVEVTWAGPAAGAVFEVKLDTHSVDLDGLDLSNSILRNDRDEMLSARPWAAPGGGHHRAGVLTFEGDAGRLFADTDWIELVIVGVGSAPERVLRWSISR